jgi:hypothetical protein
MFSPLLNGTQDLPGLLAQGAIYRIFSNAPGNDVACGVEMGNQPILNIIAQHPIDLIEQADQAVNCA